MNKFRAKEILDSNQKPTVELELETDFGVFKASVPSGVSVGKYEAVELRDEDGGVKKAIENIEKIIAPVLEKEDLTNQKRIDDVLIKLDGTQNKSRLGTNAILPVSIAVCRAGTKAKNFPLYAYISQYMENSSRTIKVPRPSFNMIEGGKHAHSTSSGQAGLAFQEFMVIPQKETFKENLAAGQKIYQKLKEILGEKFGKGGVKLSAEGAFSPPSIKIEEALDLILEAAEKTGHKEEINPVRSKSPLANAVPPTAERTSNGVKFAIDAAASSFFEDEKYKIDGKALTKEELIDFYKKLAENYPIALIEDPFSEEDFDSWKILKSEILNLKSNILIFGDDLTVSNIERIKIAQEKDSCSGLILKPNQIGTITETITAAKLAKSYGWKIMVANRAGETEDDFIADLAVGIGADFIKSGAPFPEERMAKYQRLLKIEDEMHSEV